MTGSSTSTSRGDAMIEVKDLAKHYGTFKAVRGISFKVYRGEVLGFLGPNGAGKTTTMKVLASYLAATRGGATIGGFDIRADSLAVRRVLGFLPEDTPIYPEMSVLEYLEFVGAVRDLDRDTCRRRIGDLAEVCGLLQHLARPVGQLSKGLRQRAGLAQALLHDPPILILDEPTSGLDPNQIVEIRELIREIGKEKTVVLSTHILPEVQATCGRVIIINEGRLVADGTTDELASQQHENVYELLVDSGESDSEAVDAKLRAIAGVASIQSGTTEDGVTGFTVKASGDSDLRRQIFCCVRDNDWLLLGLSQQQVTLEDIFRKLTQ